MPPKKAAALPPVKGKGKAPAGGALGGAGSSTGKKPLPAKKKAPPPVTKDESSSEEDESEEEGEDTKVGSWGCGAFGLRESVSVGAAI